MLKKSVTLRGHSTSISMEAPFWEGLRTLARRQKKPLSTLISHIDDARLGNGDVWLDLWEGDAPCSHDVLRAENLSSSVRIYVYLRSVGTGVA